MPALGQKRTSEHVRVMSAIAPKADIGTQPLNVPFRVARNRKKRTQTSPHHRRRHRKQGRRVNRTKLPGEASHFRPHVDIQSPMGAGVMLLRPTHARSC